MFASKKSKKVCILRFCIFVFSLSACVLHPIMYRRPGIQWPQPVSRPGLILVAHLHCSFTDNFRPALNHVVVFHLNCMFAYFDNLLRESDIERPRQRTVTPFAKITVAKKVMTLARKTVLLIRLMRMSKSRAHWQQQHSVVSQQHILFYFLYYVIFFVIFNRAR